MDQGRANHSPQEPELLRASEGLPKFDNLVYRFTGGDANAAIAAVLAGECDIVDQTTALDGQSQLLLQLQAKGQINATFVTGTTWEHADFDISACRIHPEHRRLRWLGCLWQHGMDLSVMSACARPLPCAWTASLWLIPFCMVSRSYLTTYLPPNHPLFAADAKHWPYDPAAAAALLDEVGWKDADNDPATPRVAQGVVGVPDNTPLEFNYETTNSTMRQQVTQILAQNLAGCGMKVNLSYYPASQWFAAGPDGKLYGRLYDLGQFAWLTGVTPPCDLYLSTQLPTEANGWSGQNNPGFHDADYDKACNTQLQSLPGEPAYRGCCQGRSENLC